MKTLTVIFPVFNEESRIQSVFRAVESFIPPENVEIKEVIFTNDGSVDGTKMEINKWQEKYTGNYKITLVSYKVNRGRGYVLRQALSTVQTDLALYLDGDMAVPLENTFSLVDSMNQDVDLVVGSKKKPGANCQGNFNLIRTVVGLGHSLSAFFILGIFYWDFQGGFKLFSKKLIQNVVPLTTIDRWGFDMEIIFLAEKLGYKCREIPIKWRGYGKDSRVKLVRDIFFALRDMLDIRWRWEKAQINGLLGGPKIARVAY